MKTTESLYPPESRSPSSSPLPVVTPPEPVPDKYERLEHEAYEEAKRMGRDNLISHYMCAMLNWEICINEIERLRKQLAEKKP